MPASGQLTGYFFGDFRFDSSAHWQLLLRVSRSWILQIGVPTGNCKFAVPLCWKMSSVTCTRRSGGVCVRLHVPPFFFTVPCPDNWKVQQQKM